ncbi:MAG: diadenylate cyclase CdaA [Clostridia bacterium]|nr:diadenylate cyclase CdaA [Clostridia bacterium]
MNGLFELLGDFFLSIWRMLASINIIDVIDILLLSIFFYYIYKFMHERRAGKLVVGIVVFIILLILSEVLGMHAIKFILRNVVQVGMLALIILFQPEIRSALEEVGREPLKNIKMIAEQRDITKINSNIDQICSAVFSMSESKTGALIVIERMTKLGDVINSGVLLNADISSFLIRNIFFNKAPLHDGAIVIREGRVYAAGCFLPLSFNSDIVNDLGTRHRAAIGISENSDAVVICVSEETGTVSLALEGKLKRGYDEKSLKEELTSLVLNESYLEKMRSKNLKKKTSEGAKADSPEDN